MRTLADCSGLPSKLKLESTPLWLHAFFKRPAQRFWLPGFWSEGWIYVTPEQKEIGTQHGLFVNL